MLQHARLSAKNLIQYFIPPILLFQPYIFTELNCVIESIYLFSGGGEGGWRRRGQEGVGDSRRLRVVTCGNWARLSMPSKRSYSAAVSSVVLQFCIL